MISEWQAPSLRNLNDVIFFASVLFVFLLLIRRGRTVVLGTLVTVAVFLFIGISARRSEIWWALAVAPVVAGVLAASPRRRPAIRELPMVNAVFVAFIAIHAHPVPTFGVVVMAYIIGALGGSIPLPASVGAVGGIVGMLIVYGVGHDAAVAAVLLYQAIGLLVPLIGGGLAYLMLRSEFAAARRGRAAQAASASLPE